MERFYCEGVYSMAAMGKKGGMGVGVDWLQIRGGGGAETLKPSGWRARPEPVDLFESAVKHRAGGYTAQRAGN